jgi:hypothetical protein
MMQLWEPASFSVHPALVAMTLPRRLDAKGANANSMISTSVMI